MISLKRGSVTGLALSPIDLKKGDFALLLVYNQSLTTASQSQLFVSVVRALVLSRAQEYLHCYGYHVVSILVMLDGKTEQWSSRTDNIYIDSQ